MKSSRGNAQRSASTNSEGSFSNVFGLNFTEEAGPAKLDNELLFPPGFEFGTLQNDYLISGSGSKTESDGTELSEEKKLEKLERNREIARKCRKRKRERSNALADEVTRLREINKNLEVQLKIAQGKLGKATTGRGNRGEEEESRRLSEVSLLSHLVENRASDSEVLTRLQHYSTLYADFGEERQRVIETLFIQLERLLLPTQVSKMLLWLLDTQQNSDFYSTVDENSLWNTLCQELDLTPKQKTDLLQYREAITKQSEKFKTVLCKLQNLRNEVVKGIEARKENFDNVTKVITASQQAKFLNWVEHNQACIQLLDNLWLTQQTAAAAATTATANEKQENKLNNTNIKN